MGSCATVASTAAPIEFRVDRYVDVGNACDDGGLDVSGFDAGDRPIVPGGGDRSHRASCARRIAGLSGFLNARYSVAHHSGAAIAIGALKPDAVAGHGPAGHY